MQNKLAGGKCKQKGRREAVPQYVLNNQNLVDSVLQSFSSLECRSL